MRQMYYHLATVVSRGGGTYQFTKYRTQISTKLENQPFTIWGRRESHSTRTK